VWFLLVIESSFHIQTFAYISEYVEEHVLREAHKICIAMSVTLGIAAVQKSAEDTLIGAELVQKMLWLVWFKIKRAFRILRVLKKQSDVILFPSMLCPSINSYDDSFSILIYDFPVPPGTVTWNLNCSIVINFVVVW